MGSASTRPWPCPRWLPWFDPIVPLQRRPWRSIRQHKVRWARLKIGRSQCSIDPVAAPFRPPWFRQKKVRYGNMFSLDWCMVFGIVRDQEGADISTLLRDLTRDHRRVGRVIRHYANQLAELIPFRFICKNAMIVAALSEIFRKRWGAKKDGLYLSQ